MSRRNPTIYEAIAWFYNIPEYVAEKRVIAGKYFDMEISYAMQSYCKWLTTKNIIKIGDKANEQNKDNV